MKKLTILIAAVALVCFSVPAMAVDWNFYGNARIATYYVSDDYGDGRNAAGTSDDDAELQWDMQGNSRVGANIKAENLKAQFEFGVSSDSGGGGNVSARRLYGEWKFGDDMFLRVGKEYTPVSQFTSGQVYDADLGLLGIGTQYGNREAQVAFGFGNFEIALIQPHVEYIEGLQATSTTSFAGTLGTTPINVTTDIPANGDPDRVLPKFEAKWGMSFDAWNFNLQGGYQYYSIADVTSAKNGQTNDLDVTSYTLGADVGFNFGPAYVKAAGAYGQNWDNAAWALGGNHNQGSPAVWDGDDDVKDTTSWMASLVAGLKVSDMLSFEGGFGYRSDDPDVSGSKKSEPWAVYVQSVIALAPGVYVIPEIGYFDGDQDFAGDDATTTFYAGGKWQINF
jgi:hypothetical protein